MNRAHIYQLRVSLRGSRPLIWRCIQVPDCIALAQLHRIIQVSMNWLSKSPYYFLIHELYFCSTMQEEMMTRGNVFQADMLLKHLKLAPTASFQYACGEICQWLHDVFIEKILPATSGKIHPCCLGGKGASPPEDCDGVNGYKKLLKLMNNPISQVSYLLDEHFVTGFDPNRFDLAAINKILHLLDRQIDYFYQDILPQ